MHQFGKREGFGMKTCGFLSLQRRFESNGESRAAAACVKRCGAEQNTLGSSRIDARRRRQSGRQLLDRGLQIGLAADRSSDTGKGGNRRDERLGRSNALFGTGIEAEYDIGL